MTQSAMAQTLGFQAEVRQLLHLMVHSLYSEKEIFLRELISNASDANDKLRFAAIATPELLGEGQELAIDVEIDADGGCLSVTDNGIGMSRDEVVEQLGTIAHSGTGRFLEQLTGDERNDSRLIGQFGVGFYSVFMVADSVEVLTRRADLTAADGVRWSSDGKGEFTVEHFDKSTRGTQIKLHIKADQREFLDEFRIRNLIRKYSDHISFPVRLKGAESDSSEAVNHAKALWTRPRGEIAKDEYLEFYKHITHDFSEPLAWSHNRVEGKREYTSLLYVPSKAPFDLWNRESPRGLKLYVQRVFISDDATYFLPIYLRFVRGIVDSRDLALNVSRELLQEDPHVGSIRSALTKRVLGMLEKLAVDEPEKYATFWREFGSVLKEGLAEDSANREQLAALLRFNSTASEGDTQDRSLQAYREKMADDQDSIYYVVAESLAVARSSPHLETLREKGIEVLLLTDRIDEWMVQYLTEFDGKPLRDISRGELDVGGDKAPVEPSAEHEELLQRVKAVLSDEIGEVRMSRRLKESPACLVLGAQDLGYQMREILKAAGHEAPESVPDLELNPEHSLIKRLAREKNEQDFDVLARLVLDQAFLSEGRTLRDPAAYVKRLNALLVKLGIDSDG